MPSSGPLETERAHRRDRPEIADIFRDHGDAFRRRHHLTEQELRVMTAISVCRTSVLGGHVEVCDSCGHIEISYNSCRNRHCPKCQYLAQARWLELRKLRILPTHYFHLVFTMPSQLRTLAFTNQKVVYDLLFRCAAATLSELAADPEWLGGQLGITAVLHTWTRELDFHPHVHCIVTGGGLAPDGSEWKASPEGFLFPVRVLSSLFRGKMVSALRAARRAGELDLSGRSAVLSAPEAFNRLMDRLFNSDWVVYAKRPFGGPEKVYEYLGRYTHRVAMANSRLHSVEGGVTFATKNGQSITLAPEEFIRRFLLHILPPRFVKIRHFGLLAACNATTKLEVARGLLEDECSGVVGVPPTTLETGTNGQDVHSVAQDRQSLDWKALLAELTGEDLRICPRCGQGRMIRLPLAWLETSAPDFEDSS